MELESTINHPHGPVSSTQEFDSITAGHFHACGLDGTDAFCWGKNNNGQIGNDTTPTDAANPRWVAGNLKFRTLSAGGYHTCGVTVDNEAYCWGLNGNGQLGTGQAGTGDNNWNQGSNGYPPPNGNGC